MTTIECIYNHVNKNRQVKETINWELKVKSSNLLFLFLKIFINQSFNYLI